MGTFWQYDIYKDARFFISDKSYQQNLDMLLNDGLSCACDKEPFHPANNLSSPTRYRQMI